LYISFKELGIQKILALCVLWDLKNNRSNWVFSAEKGIKFQDYWDGNR
jgi:hypothetical protein